MYAVIKTGGKQYKVSQGDVLEVEHLKVKSEETTFTPILVVDDKGNTVYGASQLKEYTVGAKILGDAKGDKVTVLKYRPKSGYASRTGHRQLYSLIEITSIGAKGSKTTKKSSEEKPAATEEAAAETASTAPTE